MGNCMEKTKDAQGDNKPEVVGASKGFQLPTENAIKGVADQGWQFSTVVGTSKIPGAGNGRFAEQKIGKGSQVIVKTLRPMAKIDTLLQVPFNTTITFSSVNDLEKYIKLAETEGGYSRKEILTLFEHFMYACDGKVCCLNVSTWTVNHSDTYDNGLNVLVMTDQTMPDGSIAYVGEAMCDIQKGDEFYMDYRRFEQPKFYVEFTNKLSYMDVRKATLHAVYGSDEDAKIYANNKPLNEYAGGGLN